MILAIDTATDQASLALLADHGLVAELSWSARGSHSSQLGVLLPQLLDMESLSVADLTGLAVASGPGSFNGLRVGISLAKGLALARSLPLAGISTLDVTGYAAAGMKPVCASLPAGRGELYLSRYDGEGDTWRRTSDYLRLKIDAAAEEYREGTLLAGEGASVLAEAVVRRGLAPALQSPGDRLRRAGYLAELGRQYFDEHGREGLEDVQPLYLRRSSAEEKRAASQGE